MVQTRLSNNGSKSPPLVKPNAVEKTKSKITIKKANLSTIVKKKTPKVKKPPPGIPCITLRINDSDLNHAEEVAPYIGNYFHYPISQITAIDEV